MRTAELGRRAARHIHGDRTIGSGERCGGGGGERFAVQFVPVGGGGQGLGCPQVGVQELQLNRLSSRNGDHGAFVDLICPVSLLGSSQLDRDRVGTAVELSTHVSRRETS